MDIKEFFKPTRWRVGLFILIFFLIFSLTPCKSTSFFSPGEVKWSICGLLNKITYLSGQYITDVNYSYLGFINLDKNIYSIFIFELLISYLISCTIIKLIFRKWKKYSLYFLFSSYSQHFSQLKLKWVLISVQEKL